MSLETLTNKTTVQGNASTTVFPYAFIIPTADDAVITFTDSAGTQTVLVAAQYTITGLNNANGGTVTYPLTGSPMAAGESLTIERVVPYTQTTVLTNQGGYFPDVVEAALDEIVMQTQQLEERIGASLQFPAVDPAANAIAILPAWQARKSSYLFFDALGNAGVAAGTASAAVSAAMAPVVAAATLAAGRTAFGLGTGDSPTFNNVTAQGKITGNLGTGSGAITAVGTLNTQTSAAGIGNGADSTDDTLFTYTLPAASLAVNGQSVRVRAWGVFANNTNSKSVKVFFAGVGFALVADATTGGLNWYADITIVRLDDTHVSVGGMGVDSGAVGNLVRATPNQAVSSLAANASIIKVTGASAASAANDVLGYAMKVSGES